MTIEAPGVLATLKTYLDSLAGESDRGVALAVAAAFEEELGALLRAHMVEGKVTDALLSGALTSFASRIGACHAIGLINDDEQSALTAIREIRNAFAHRWPSTGFDVPEIESRCWRLPARRSSTFTCARDHYTAAISELLLLMIERARHVKRVQPDWWT